VADEDLADDEAAPERRPAHTVIDGSVAHPARVYDYWLGGKDNYAADRRAGDAVKAVRPAIVRDVRANRGFMRRAAAYLAGHGVRQFLDIGSGIPTSPNLHEVVQDVDPAGRVVYVDNDPVVLAQARALLASSPEGATDYIDADLRNPRAILRQAERTLDFSSPVAVFLVSILWLIGDAEDPYGIVETLMDAVSGGSCLVVSHPASDIESGPAAKAVRRYSRLVTSTATLRSYGEVSRFFQGLELVPPGMTQCHLWRPEGVDDTGEQYQVAGWAAVGWKHARPGGHLGVVADERPVRLGPRVACRPARLRSRWRWMTTLDGSRSSREPGRASARR
jgi:hypothetical protein